MKPTEETKEQFMERYVNASRDCDIFEKQFIVLPCDCEDGGGPTHWGAVRRDAEMIESHLDLYAPKGTPWPEGIPKHKDALA